MDFTNILTLLQAKFAGVRKDGLAHIARILALNVTTEDDAKNWVEKLTQAQVDGFIKDFRAEVDKEVSACNKTYEETLRKKYDFTERQQSKKDDKPDEGGADKDIAKLVKAAIAEAVKPLQTELAGFKAKDVAQTRLQALTDKLSGCKSEAFKAKALKDFGRMQFETDDAFTEYLTDTEKDIAAANQGAAEAGLGRMGRPFVPTTTPDGKKEATDAEVSAVMEKLPV
jgi:hypothetical protein